MRQCPCCGTVKIEDNDQGGNTCLRPQCGHTSPRKFRELYKDTMPSVPGAAIGLGCFWILPKRTGLGY